MGSTMLSSVADYQFVTHMRSFVVVILATGNLLCTSLVAITCFPIYDGKIESGQYIAIGQSIS